ncbi:MAG TPA: ImmA/IrrE family metallo-endopeptidase [Candidatus Limnocylindria bacterium]|nr:ImmA/IrrE family metallo-endopeptidase [Candidatus Limnocylindria bacterium]
MPALGARTALIARVLEEKRALHPEMARPLTWNGLVAILRRERIPLVRTALVRTAACLTGGRVTVILVNSNVPPRRHTYFVAHELAHAWIHADDEADPVFHIDLERADDVREEEAELLATWLLGDESVRRYFQAV